MSYSLKSTCQLPQLSKDVSECLCCESKLLLQGRYCILKPISQGGFSKTFLAVDKSHPSQPPCALKQFFPQPHNTNNKKIASALFRQEAQHLEVLGQHPQIPELLDYFEQDGQQYLVQEFIDGPNLEQELIEAGAFNEFQMWQLLHNLLPVLQFVHDHQIIHRDIKPTNIIRRCGDGQLVLVDFGAAKSLTDNALGQTGTMIGSAEYAAPEQIKGKAVTASDLYSLGVTCIHLLTQIPPFDLFDSSEDAWVWRDYLSSPVSQSLNQLLDRLLQPAIKHRYQSGAEVLKDLNSSSTQIVTESLLTFEADTTDIERSEQPLAQPTHSSLLVPVQSATVFDPQTHSWYHLRNLFEPSELVWAVAPFLCPRSAIPSSTPVLVPMSQVDGTEDEVHRGEQLLNVQGIQK